jgi:hypothetical protein
MPFGTPFWAGVQIEAKNKAESKSVARRGKEGIMIPEWLRNLLLLRFKL